MPMLPRPGEVTKEYYISAKKICRSGVWNFRTLHAPGRAELSCDLGLYILAGGGGGVSENSVVSRGPPPGGDPREFLKEKFTLRDFFYILVFYQFFGISQLFCKQISGLSYSKN